MNLVNFLLTNCLAGTHTVWRDGRLVQLGKKDGQVGRFRRHKVAHIGGDQGGGEGGSVPRPVHLSARKPLPLPLRAEQRRGELAPSQGGRRLEGVLRRGCRRDSRRVCDEIRD